MQMCNLGSATRLLRMMLYTNNAFGKNQYGVENTHGTTKARKVENLHKQIHTHFNGQLDTGEEKLRN